MATVMLKQNALVLIERHILQYKFEALYHENGRSALNCDDPLFHKAPLSSHVGLWPKC
jgi:hypothetical protein